MILRNQDELNLQTEPKHIFNTYTNVCFIRIRYDKTVLPSPSLYNAHYINHYMVNITVFWSGTPYSPNNLHSNMSPLTVILLVS